MFTNGNDCGVKKEVTAALKEEKEGREEENPKHLQCKKGSFQ